MKLVKNKKVKLFFRSFFISFIIIFCILTLLLGFYVCYLRMESKISGKSMPFHTFTDWFDINATE